MERFPDAPREGGRLRGSQRPIQIGPATDEGDELLLDLDGRERAEVGRIQVLLDLLAQALLLMDLLHAAPAAVDVHGRGFRQAIPQEGETRGRGTLACGGIADAVREHLVDPFPADRRQLVEVAPERRVHVSRQEELGRHGPAVQVVGRVERDEACEVEPPELREGNDVPIVDVVPDAAQELLQRSKLARDDSAMTVSVSWWGIQAAPEIRR